MEENILERVIKLESQVENMKENIDKNNQKISDFTSKIHNQEVYQARIENKIDSLALEIKRFREDSLENRKVQLERLKKIEEERQEEKNQPGQSWNKIKISIITSIATGICLAIIYFLFNSVKF